MPRYALVAALLALPLAACGSEHGTSISFSDEGNNSTVVANGTSGQVAINVPGFQGNVTLPKIDIKAGDLDLNGVKLPPDSHVVSLNVQGDGDKGGNGKVQVVFETPSDTAAVQRWFLDRMPAKGFTVKPDGNGLSGTTEEGKPFTLQIDPQGSGKSRSSLSIS